MKLTRTQLVVGGVIGVLIVGAGLLIYYLSIRNGRDTPVVAGGGSIYGKTDDTSLTWKNEGTNVYSTSINPVSGKNQYGIDYLVITGFEKDPTNPIKGTKGWAISFSNPRSANAVRFCSDATCSASQTLMDGSKNPSICSGSFNQSPLVYFGTAMQGATLHGVPPGSPPYELDFDDTDSSCNPNGNCNKVKDATLETCDGQTYPKFDKCKVNSSGHQECIVTVGEP